MLFMYYVWLISGLFFVSLEGVAQEDVRVTVALTTELNGADLHKIEVERALESLNVNDSAIFRGLALKILKAQSNPGGFVQQASPFLGALPSSPDKVKFLEMLVSISQAHRPIFINSIRFLSFMSDKIQLMNTLFMLSRKDPEEWLSMVHYFKKWFQVEEETIGLAIRAMKSREVYNTIGAILNVPANDRDGFLERMRRLTFETNTFGRTQKPCLYATMFSYAHETFYVLSRYSLAEIDALEAETRSFRQDCDVPHDCALLLQKLAPLNSGSRRRVIDLSSDLFRPRMTKSDQIWIITTLAGLPVPDWERLVQRAQCSRLWCLPVYTESPQGKEVFYSRPAGTVFYVEALVENLEQPL